MADTLTQWVGRNRVECLLVCLVLLNGTYFYNGMNWNHIARFDPVFSFVEPGTADSGSFRIDRFVPVPEACDNTGDWARNPDHGPHVYSNKAPGPILLAIPPYFLLYHTERLLGYDPLSATTTQFNCYILNFLVSVLPLAIALPLFFRTLLRLAPGHRRAAVFCAVGLGAGTLMFPYSTQFWGHVTAAACVMLALDGITRRTLPGAAFAGFAAGWAVLGEYSCAVTVALLGLWLLLQRDWRVVVAYGAGGFLPFVIHVAYHRLCFGQWLTAANLHNNPAFKDESLAGGIFGGISAEALNGLTISPYRGLFYHMPVLLLALLGLLALGRRRYRVAVGIALLHIGLFLAWNLSFNGWHGGACVGPRYQIPTLPFYLLLAYLGMVSVGSLLRWRLSPGSARWGCRIAGVVAGGLLLLSIANMGAIAIVSPMGNVNGPNPLRAYYIFIQHGEFRLYGQPSLRLDQPALPRTLQSFNLGERAGLTRLPSLVPWLSGLALLLLALALLAGRRGGGRTAGSPKAPSTGGDSGPGTGGEADSRPGATGLQPDSAASRASGDPAKQASEEIHPAALLAILPRGW